MPERLSQAGAATVAAGNGHPSVEPEELAFHCHGCGRRIFTYTPGDDGGLPIMPGKRMRKRCRDCKAWNLLEGPQVVGALRSVLEGTPTQHG